MSDAPKKVHRIVCLGDSITLAIGEAELDKWPVRVAWEIEKEWGADHALFIRAWNGATTFDALQRMNAEVGYLLPGTVLVAFGVNDAHVPSDRRAPQVGVAGFAANLREIHALISERGGKTIFVVQHIPSPSLAYVPGNGKTYAENFAPYRQEILKAAQELGVPVIDLPTLLEERGTAVGAIVAADGLHLTTGGNAVYAELIFKKLRSLLPQYSL